MGENPEIISKDYLSLFALDNLQGTENDNFVGLYLVNHKEYVNSKLTFEKQWDDNSNKQNTRPDSIYIKTLRRTKGSLLPDKNDSFTAKPGEVDFKQITLFQNLPQYNTVERKETDNGEEKTVTDQYPYVYFLEPSENITVTDVDQDGTVKVDLSKISEEVRFQLKRKISSYTYQTYSPKDGEFTIPISDAMNGTYSIRLKNLDIAKNGINCVYRIVDESGNEMKVKMTHIQTSDEKKDIVFVPVDSNDNPLTFDENLVFQVQCHSGEEDENGAPVFEKISEGFTVEKYFEESKPLITYTASKLSDDSDSAVYTIPQKDQYGTIYSFKVSGVTAGTTYRITDQEGNALSDAVTADGTEEMIFTVANIPTELSFKIQKQSKDENDHDIFTDLTVNDVQTITVGKYYEEVVTQDKNDTQLRLEYFPKDAQTKIVKTDHYGNSIGYEDSAKKYSYTTSFTIPVSDAYEVSETEKKFSVLVKNLPKGNYTVNNGSVVERHVKDSVGNKIVDLLVTKTITKDSTEDFTFTITPPTGSELPGSLTAVRYFVSDSNGIVQLPSDVAKSVAENLAYGVSKSMTVVNGENIDPAPSEQFNGLWEKYYYTVVECDKDGWDDHSSLTFGQEEIEPVSPDTDLPTSKKLIFMLDTSTYHQENDPNPRKYLNIKIVNTTNNSIVKRDINGDALKVTIYNGDTLIGEYYASDEANTIPAEGVIVIPIPVYCDRIRCEVDGLPYGVKNDDGSDWLSQYEYSVERCKASGKTHDGGLPIASLVNGESVEQATPFTENTNFKHKTLNFNYTKSWDETAKYYHLRPETVYFGLYRRYEGSTTEKLVKKFSKKVTSDTVSDNTAIVKPEWLNENEVPLPAGTIVTENGIDVWKTYTYYLKEYTDDNYHTEKSYNNQYEASTLYEPDKPFVPKDYTYAELDQGLTNKLQKTKHEVLKIWDDSNDIFESREDYTLALWRKTSQSEWEKVDLRDVVISSVKVDEETKVKTFTRVNLPASDTAIEELKVNQAKLQYCFDHLPIYDKNGLAYSYQITETKIGSNPVDNQTYLSFVPGTLVDDDEFSYVRTIRRGTENYYVDYGENELTEYTDKEGVTYLGTPDKDSGYQAESYGECIITNQISTDTVSFSNFKATKVWDDENNLDGKRPESLIYTLKRTKTLNGETTDDTFFSNPKTVTAADNWTAEWKQCAAKAPDGSQFDYYIEETAVPNYTTTTVTKDLGNTKQYIFTNTYVPEKRKITAYKVWDDQSDRFHTRPATVRYALWCRYQIYENQKITNDKGESKVVAKPKLDENDEPVYFEGLVYNPEIENSSELSAVYRAMLAHDPTLTGDKAKEYFEKILDETTKDNQNQNRWKVEFENLPDYVNGLGDNILGGESVQVTYYIKETFDDDTTANLYQCPDKEDSKKSEELFLLQYGKAYSNETNNNDGTFTVPKSYSLNGIQSFEIPDLPSADIFGNPYRYYVKETSNSGGVVKTEESAFRDNSNGKTTVLVTNELPKIYFKIQRKIDPQADYQTILKNADGERLTVTINNIPYQADSNGLFAIPRTYYADNDNHIANFTLTNLPEKTEDMPVSERRTYTYAVLECDSSGSALANVGDSNKLQMTKTVDNGSVSLTVTKPLGTESQDITYQLYRMVKGKEYTYIVTDADGKAIKDVTATMSAVVDGKVELLVTTPNTETTEYTFKVRRAIDGQHFEDVTDTLTAVNHADAEQTFKSDATTHMLTIPKNTSVRIQALDAAIDDGQEEGPLKNIVYEKRIEAEKDAVKYPADKDKIISVPKSSVRRRNIVVTVSNLPKGYSYSIKECMSASDATAFAAPTASYTVADSTDTVTLTVKSMAPVLYFQVIRKDENGTETVVNPIATMNGKNLIVNESGIITAEEKNMVFSVKINDLPKTDDQNQEYSYSIGSVNSTPALEMASSESNGKVTLTVSKTFGNVYYRIFDSSGNAVTVLNGKRLQSLVGSEKITAAPDGTLMISEFYARKNTLTVKIPGLTEGTYTVTEYAEDGHVISSNSYSLTIEEGEDSATLTLSKNVTAIPDNFTFRVKQNDTPINQIVTGTQDLKAVKFLVSDKPISEKAEDDLTAASDHRVTITNTLETRDISMALNWDDQGYGGKVTGTKKTEGMHYPITAGLTSENHAIAKAAAETVNPTEGYESKTYRTGIKGLIKIPYSEHYTINSNIPEVFNSETSVNVIEFQIQNLPSQNTDDPYVTYQYQYSIIECDENGNKLSEENSNYHYFTSSQTGNSFTGKSYVKNSADQPEYLYYKVLVTVTMEAKKVITMTHGTQTKNDNGDVTTMNYSTHYREGNAYQYAVGNGVRFENMPLYDSSGNLMDYKAYESPIENFGSLTKQANIHDYQIYDLYDTVQKDAESENPKIYHTKGDEVGENAESDSTYLSGSESTSYFSSKSNGSYTRHYLYQGSAQAYQKAPVIRGADASQAVMHINMLNTLPLTSVKVEKHWDDQSNEFKLRPSDINDVNKTNTTPDTSLNLKIYRQLSTDNDAWSPITYTETSQHETEWYKTEEETQSDEWTFTYQKLLKADENNTLYHFKIEETKLKPYYAPQYCAKNEYDKAVKGETYTNKQIITEVTTLPEGATWNGETPLTQTFEITNKLETIDVIVAKSWADNGYEKASDLHYNVRATLSSDDITMSASSNRQNTTSGKYEDSKVIEKTAGNGVKFTNLPRYQQDGTAIVYRVKEDATDNNSTEENTETGEVGQLTNAYHESTSTTNLFTVGSRRYGYVGTCTLETDSNNGNMQFNILNTLPLTAVQVNKHWIDQNNEFNLRPSDISANLTLARNNGSGDYSNITPTTDKTSWYTSESERPVNSASNEWTYTYRKLLKQDVNNNAYHFQITEAKVTAYEAPKYCVASEYDYDTDNDNTTTQQIKQTVTDVEVNNPDTEATKQFAWDGTHPLVETFEITNKLDTRDIKVYKHWDDNNDALRYLIDVTLSSTAENIGSRHDTSNKYHEVQSFTSTENDRYVTFEKLPKYDKDGAVIVYHIREDAYTKNSTPATDRPLSMTQRTADGNYELSTIPTFIDGDRHYGYVGSAEYVAESKIVSSQTKIYATEYHITNKLPVRSFTAHKTWDDDNNRDNLRPASLTFTLTRSLSNTISDSELTQSEIDLKTTSETVDTKTAKYTEDKSTCWKVDFGEYPQCSYSNKPYVYNVEESSTVSDLFTPSKYTLVDNSPTITNDNYEFTNRHPITEQQFTVKKIWNDGAYKDTVRPAESKVKVELWCRFSNGNGGVIDKKVLTDTSEDNTAIKKYIQSKNASYNYEPALSAFTPVTGHTDYERTYVFDHLPVYVHLDSTETYNGTTEKWYAVTYYVKEVFDNGYEHIYQSEYSKDNSTYYSEPYANNTADTGTNLLKNNVPTDDNIIYIKNTPVTRDILVTKEWDDNGYGVSTGNDKVSELSKNLHYNTAIQLKAVAGENTIYNQTMYLAPEEYATNHKGVLFKDVPIYKADGSVIDYTVTESKTTQSAEQTNLGAATGTLDAVSEGEFTQLKGLGQYSYGYQGSAKKTVETGHNNAEYVTRYHITDTLPLTAVQVNKHWIDQDNEFNLRPSDIADKLTLSRYATSDTVSDLASETFEALTSSENNLMYVTESKKSGNTDTYTYKKILKYNESNNPYIFKIVETPVTAYQTPTYDQQYLNYDKVLPEDKTTNGQTALDNALEVTNTLDTRSITVYKHWEDNNNSNNTRYQVDVTLSSTAENIGNRKVSESDKTYKETKTIAIQNNDTDMVESVTFEKLPKYDKNGAVIVYHISEDANGVTTDNYGVFTIPAEYISGGNASFTLKNLNKNQSYKIVNVMSNSEVYSVNVVENEEGTRDVLVTISSVTAPLLLKLQSSTNGTDYTDVTNVEIEMAKKSDSAATLTSIPTFIDGSRKYGYSGSAVYKAEGTTPYATEYHITNTLPQTFIKVTKSWAEIDYLHKYQGTYFEGETVNKNYRDVSMQLKRKSGSAEGYTNLGTAVPIPFSDTNYQNDTIFSHLPVYDESNQVYSYQVEEVPLRGYTTAYDIENGIVTAEERASTEPQEVGVTNTPIKGDAQVIKIDQTHYNAYSVYKTLSGVKFALTCNDTAVYVTTDTDGTYILDKREIEESEKSNIVESGENGVISFKDFPLNTYTLTETEALEGYLKNETPATLTIDVANDTSTSATITYGEGFILDNKIGNHQKVETVSVTLVKSDAEDFNTHLPNTTYYLLQMFPYAIGGSGYDSEPAYKKAADDELKAMITDNGHLPDDMKFWHTPYNTTDSALQYIYTTDENGGIGPIQNLMTGRYAFVEVKAAEGYQLSFCEPFEISESNKVITVTHKDPRKSANLNILKENEYGDPLNGAEFELYYQPENAEPLHLATVKTGDDGFINEITYLKTKTNSVTVDDDYILSSLTDKTVTVKNWGDYFWKEKTPPVGYEANQSKLEFTITASEAERKVYVVTASDTRKHGKITLTKTSEQKLGTTDIGTKLESAEFQLYNKTDE